MNKTLIIFGLVIIVIGILVAVLNITKKEESFDNIENFDHFLKLRYLKMNLF